MSLMHHFHLWLGQHPVSCFVLMTISFVSFGCLTFDLVRLVSANAAYLSNYGLMALQEGGLQQMLELWLKAFAAMLFWVMFKLCELNLVKVLTMPPSDD